MKISGLLLLLPLLLLLSCGARIDLNGDLDGGAVADNNAGGGGGADPDPIVGAIGYQLDEDPAVIAGFGAGVAAATMSNNNQTASYSLAGAPASDLFRLAFPANFSTAPVTIDISTGKKAIECEYTFPNAVNSGGVSEAYITTCAVLESPYVGTDIAYVKLLALTNGTFSIEASVGGVLTTWSGLAHNALPSKMALEFNANTSTVTLYFDGVTQALNSNTYTPQDAIIAISIAEFTANPAGNAGSTITTRLITKAAEMTTDFSVGTVDPFGDPAP